MKKKSWCAGTLHERKENKRLRMEKQETARIIHHDEYCSCSLLRTSCSIVKVLHNFFNWLLNKLNRCGIHTMTLIWRRVRKPLSAKNVTKMSVAHVAQDLNTTSIAVRFTNHLGHVRPKTGPTAATIEFMFRFVEWGLASSADVYSVRSKVHVVLASVRRVGSLVSEDRVLFRR